MSQPVVDDLSITSNPNRKSITSLFVHRRIWRIVAFCLLAAATVYAVPSGISLRRALFDWSDTIHHEDVYNAHARGLIASDAGILDVYDKLERRELRVGRFSIDYAPLRLVAITTWARWTQERRPGEPWTLNYETLRPLLVANTSAALVSSALVFLLIRLCIRRSMPIGNPKRNWLTGVNAGLIGALLFWFNPALLWNAHCWPQWDVWLMPFFLAAVLLACLDWWFAAAVCVVAGAFFKGQILLVAPLLVLWPLFQLRIGAVLRFIAGGIAATAAFALPWMWTGDMASSVWLGLISLATIAILILTIRRPSRDWRLIAIAIVTAVLITWPWASAASLNWKLAGIVPLAIASTLFCLPKRWFPIAIAASCGTAILLLMPLFNARTAWYTIGFEYGTQKFPMLSSATGTYSIPTIFRDYLDWPNDMETPVSIAGYEMSVRMMMFLLYAACLVLCAIAAAIHDKRRDPRFLLAIITPWVCFFSLLTQMNNRYLVWAAVLSSLLAGVSVGLTLLGLLLSAICVVGMAQHMLPIDPSFTPEWTPVVRALQTHLAWPVAMIALIYLYSAVTPKRAISPIPYPKPEKLPLPATPGNIGL